MGRFDNVKLYDDNRVKVYITVELEHFGPIVVHELNLTKIGAQKILDEGAIEIDSTNGGKVKFEAKEIESSNLQRPTLFVLLNVDPLKIIPM